MSPPPEPRAALYHVTADAEASVMPRMLELFARRGLVPDRVEAVRTGDALACTLATTALDPLVAAHVAACLGQLVSVHTVRLALAPDAAAA